METEANTEETENVDDGSKPVAVEVSAETTTAAATTGDETMIEAPKM